MNVLVGPLGNETRAQNIYNASPLFTLYSLTEEQQQRIRVGRNFRLFLSASDLRRLKEMAGPRIAHATLKGPSVVKEICIATVLGLAAGSVWKMHHWNEQRKVRAFYDLLEKGEISVIAQEE
ncbi:hypothetical protein HN51_039345 [Arachis hypogaea]|uniref:Cytochrome c oxidase subunit 5C n=1 Tax=Arachis hypogaea TaxID=3818 RepID=A0A444YIS0_ARAHY|nr:cytochrome c oxidase subunit 5C [Arachis ipaensis]RYR01811.1 hypothetical protein Ahy_B06g080677 [Arachis hypogaea]